jgi:Ser/Thr protein kinase RdoA (MazF antagonist)
VNNKFPLQAAVLSDKAIGEYITANYSIDFTSLTSCRLFYRSIHDVYKIATSNGEYYFKVYKQHLRKYDEILSEIDLLNHLQSSGIKAVRPIASIDGNSIGRFDTVLGERFGVLYNSAGKQSFTELDETSQLNKKLGSYIASIHKAFDEYGAINRHELNVQTFIEDSISELARFSEIHSFDIDFLIDVSEKVKAKLNEYPTDKPVYGVCHGDIYGGNIGIDSDGELVRGSSSGLRK